MRASTSDIETAADVLRTGGLVAFPTETVYGLGADVPATARLLAEHFWPGPLTLVLRRGRGVPLEATGGLETVAVRVPDHPIALALLSTFGGGLTAPSADRFASVSFDRSRDTSQGGGPGRGIGGGLGSDAGQQVCGN
ncbi:L-threonylcarbamoyladenylate synthase [Actinomadura opuntiae]|uniref:L-threonylcarbamoyladenylate synthase n=1 Tax=Actinomadura sp. OS1-43 TaxID=604315 RepID=UPI00255B1AB5|nr:Sua5/YciO/YrdC/YwlC family protein [Actinomadura sp. OS1-43]MDL4818559.1 Sua5/YciO/YrdC/YwlC family protein [Actinomadura sp. OS1-43]